MKPLNTMLEEESITLHRSIRRYLTMCRLKASANDALISNFETKRWNTLRSYDHQKEYSPYVPSYNYITDIITDIRMRDLYEIPRQN